MALKLEYESSTLKKGISNMTDKLGALVLMYASTKASDLQSKMQLGRPWRDRTGMAKATLSAKVSQPSANIVRITLAHGVNYGIWLELANSMNYAIVGPTVRQEAPTFVSDLQGIMSKLGG